MTLAARRLDRLRFIAAAPRLSVWPSIIIFLMVGVAFRSCAISVSIGKLSGRIVAEPVAKCTCCSTRTVEPSSWMNFGQPFFFGSGSG